LARKTIHLAFFIDLSQAKRDFTGVKDDKLIG